MTTHEIISLVVSIGPIIGVIIMQVRQNWQIKKDNTIIMNSLKETYAQNSKVNETLTTHVEQSVFKSELHSIVQGRSFNIIRTSQLDPKFKLILKDMSAMLENLAFLFYYNKHRKVKHEMADIIEVEINYIEDYIKSLTRLTIDDYKTIKYGSGGATKEKIISFYDFIYDEENKNPFQFLRILRVALETNGFDTEGGPDFIETMDKFTKLILTSFVDEVSEWNKIKDETNHE